MNKFYFLTVFVIGFVVSALLDIAFGLKLDLGMKIVSVCIGSILFILMRKAISK